MIYIYGKMKYIWLKNNKTKDVVIYKKINFTKWLVTYHMEHTNGKQYDRSNNLYYSSIFLQ